MKRLAKYIRPYLLALIVAVALLFIQANADLALPDYMSRIVNVGIQQRGIQNAVPAAIRASEMQRLVLFMSAADAARVTGDFTLVEPGSTEAANYVKEYPLLSAQAIYVRKALAQPEIDAIDPVVAKAWLTVSGIEKVLANPAQAAAAGASFGFDLSKLPPGVDVFSLLAKMPAAQRAQMGAAIDQKMASLTPSMMVQAATAAVKDEYGKLGVDIGKIQNHYMLSTGVIMLLLTLVSAASMVAVGFLSARIAAGLARDLRSAVFERVEGFSSAELDKFSTASLITRSTNDIMQIQMVAIMLIRMVFYAPIIGIGGIIRAIGKDSSMWWIIAAAVGVLMAMVLVVYKVAVPKFKIIQKLMDRLNLVSREALSGMMVIRAFNMQRHEEKRFDTANNDLTATMLFVNRVMVVMMPFMMLVMNGVSIVIIWIGAHQVAASSMQVGDMMAFMQYTMQIVFAFLMLSMMFIMIPRAAVSADRVADVLETEPSIRDAESPADFRNRNGSGYPVEFHGVSFRYPGAEEDALHDISFTAHPGQMTAFIGPTGSGKSTIMNLIPRFYDVTDGAIHVGGKDVRAVTQHELREKIGFVPQKATLFSGTVATNLRYADEQADDAALSGALDIAQAAEFVRSMPDGVDSEISQGGANVSGGQKQRLSIARAVVKRPPIYIFDDSFSALDYKTDAALRRALKEQTGGSAVLVVTQRVSTIKNADQIIVLDEGRIVGRGTHRELMATCETYREIATSQLSKEELA